MSNPAHLLLEAKRRTSHAYSRPGRFQRAGQPYVTLPRDLRDHADLDAHLAMPTPDSSDSALELATRRIREALRGART